MLDSVPDIKMLDYLPEFLDGLLNMLSDPNREIRQQASRDLNPSLAAQPACLSAAPRACPSPRQVARRRPPHRTQCRLEQHRLEQQRSLQGAIPPAWPKGLDRARCRGRLGA